MSLLNIQCHCGDIRITAPTPTQITRCNCSICHRYQALWGYFSPQDVAISTAHDVEAAYVWGDKELAFIHCQNCGCVTHYRTIGGEGAPRIAVNFCMAEQEQINAVPVREFDGKTLL